jgi:hypothetical protein
MALLLVDVMSWFEAGFCEAIRVPLCAKGCQASLHIKRE